MSKPTIETVPIDQLKLYPGNYRQGDIGAIVESIKANGWYGTIVAHRKTRRILAGNHRTQAAQQAGLTELPVYWISGNEAAARKILIADNRTSDLATNDEHALADLLTQLEDDLAGTGFDHTDLQTLLDRLHTETDTPVTDPEPSVPDKAKAKWGTEPGQVWTAAQQTIIIGDSTDPDTYQHLPEPAHMVFTDPPYGVAYTGGTDDALTISNDDLTPDQLTDLLSRSLSLTRHNTHPGGAFYVCSPGGPNERVFATVLQRLGIHRQTIIWAKDLFAFGRSDYHYQHEPILYGWKPGAAHRMLAGRDQSTIWTTTLADWQAKRLTRLNAKAIRELLDAGGDTTVWEHARPKRSPEHPTMKPVDLCARAIRNSTRTGDHVLDPFAGSGSTLCAAHQLDRRGTGIELDPGYAATILDRLQQLGADPTRQ